jgi:hypothetical protein
MNFAYGMGAAVVIVCFIQNYTFWTWTVDGTRMLAVGL